MAIVYRDRDIGKQIAKQLKAAQLPVEWINETSESRNYHPVEDSIKLVTMHSSKGLEFPVVFVAGVGSMPHPHVPIQEDARLLYVAMTRAIDRLVMTCDRPSRFVKRLESALEQVA
jgi:superfamily I DNA/RNA helicase